MNKKIINCLFFVLIVALPFEHFRFKFFRSLSRFLYNRFHETASFAVKIPSFIDTKIHVYASNLLILALLFVAFKQIRLKDLKPSLLIFFSICVFSILCSPCRSYLYLYISTVHLLFGVLLFFLTSSLLRGNAALLRAIFVGIVSIAAFESILAIFQFLTQNSLGFSFLGERVFDMSKGGAVIPLSEKGRWLVELFSPLPEGQKYLYRALGTLPHANIFAGYLVFSLMVTHFLFSQVESAWKRRTVGVCLFLQIFALFLTFSRAGILGYLLAAFIWFGFPLLKSGKNNRAFSIAATMIFSVAFSGAVLAPHLEARGGFFNYNAFVKNSDYGRLASQQITMEIIKDYPLLGVGYNCLTFAPVDCVPSDLVTYRDRPHNIYLLIAGETGLIGLFAFLFFLLSLCSLFFRSTNNLYFQTFFAIFSAFLFIGACDLYFLTTQVGKLLFFFTGGLVVATAVEAPERALKSIFSS